MKRRNFFKAIGWLLGAAAFWRGNEAGAKQNADHLKLADNVDEWREFDAAVKRAREEAGAKQTKWTPPWESFSKDDTPPSPELCELLGINPDGTWEPDIDLERLKRIL